MIDKNKPVYERADGTKVVTLENGYPYHVIEGDQINDELRAYLAKHPEALVPEPVPPPPTPEQIAEQRRAENLAYLASTDWYAVRFAETGKGIPADVLEKRQAARDAL